MRRGEVMAIETAAVADGVRAALAAVPAAPCRRRRSGSGGSSSGRAEAGPERCPCDACVSRSGACRSWSGACLARRAELAVARARELLERLGDQG